MATVHIVLTGAADEEVNAFTAAERAVAVVAKQLVAAVSAPAGGSR